MKDSKIYKILRIVFLTLAIISMVFALMKKVGLAASDSSNPVVYTDYPLHFGFGQGHNSINFDDSIVEELQRQFSASASNGTMRYIFLNEVTDSSNYSIITVNDTSSSPLNITNSGSFPTSSVGVSGWVVFWTVSGSSVTYTSYGSNTVSLNLNNYLSSSPTGNGYLLNQGNLLHYPLWSYQNLPIENLNGSFFVYSSDSNSGGFDSPGWTDAFVEWVEDEINPVDTDSPVDSSNTPGWLQKILSGLGTLNNTIGSGFTLIKNNIGSTRDKITQIYDYITEEPDPVVIGNNVAGALYETQLFTSFDSAKTSITGVYNSFSNVSARTSSQVAFSIPFSLPYINFSSNFIIDFAWYENVRSVIEPFLNMVLSVGFLFSLIRSIPGILHGNSGEGDT